MTGSMGRGGGAGAVAGGNLQRGKLHRGVEADRAGILPVEAVDGDEMEVAESLGAGRQQNAPHEGINRGATGKRIPVGVAVDGGQRGRAVREFTSTPVGDEVVARILDNARFAPSGANAQAWHVVSVRDPAVRVRLRQLYQPGWRDYLAMGAAGLRPWAPTNDRDAETARVATATEPAQRIERRSVLRRSDGPSLQRESRLPVP
jgi:hypothetical protein